MTDARAKTPSPASPVPSCCRHLSLKSQNCNVMIGRPIDWETLSLSLENHCSCCSLVIQDERLEQSSSPGKPPKWKSMVCMSGPATPTLAIASGDQGGPEHMVGVNAPMPSIGSDVYPPNCCSVALTSRHRALLQVLSITFSNTACTWETFYSLRLDKEEVWRL